LLGRKGQKAACQRKSTTDKKERIAYSTLGVDAEGRDEDDDGDDE
jgi:hypothetical protein